MAWGVKYSGAGAATPGAGPGRETLPPIGDSELNDSKGYVKKISPARKLFQRFSKVSNSNDHSKSRRWSKIFGHSLCTQKVSPCFLRLYIMFSHSTSVRISEVK
jgi:hypothetical protein